MLRLRPYRESDAQYIVPWIQDERAFYLWSAGRLGEYPITSKALNEYYAAYRKQDDFFVMTAFDEAGVAGQLLMRFLDEAKLHLHFGFIIVASDRRGKGYGQEMLHLALKYAFDILKASKITLGVFETNQKACACYKKVGFRPNPHKEPDIYRLMGEEWTCMELEITTDRKEL